MPDSGARDGPECLVHGHVVVQLDRFGEDDVLVVATGEIISPLGFRLQIKLGSRLSLDRLCNPEQIDEATAFQFQLKLLDRTRSTSGDDAAKVDRKLDLAPFGADR